MINFSFLNLIKRLDWALVIAVSLLSAISLVSLFCLSQDNSHFYFKKQLLYVAIGFFLMLAMSLVDYQIFRNYSLFLLSLYGFCLLLLVAVLFLGDKIRGMVGWFNFGGFHFAPVEFSKMVIILILAKYFSLRHIELYKMRHIIASGIYAGLPIFLVLLQPDLGSAIVLVAIWIGMIIISGIRLRNLLILILIGAILCGIMWIGFLKDYQKERILTFFNPQKDPLGYSYNLRQSIIAVGSGGLWGKGLGEGTQAKLGFLPEAHTDFIFAAIAEQFGFVGVLFLFFIFSFVIYRILKISFQASNNFSRLFAVGVIIMLFFQIVINIGMNIGLVPIIGIPLPFLSYGGSATIINFLCIGILQSIRVRN